MWPAGDGGRNEGGHQGEREREGEGERERERVQYSS